MINKTSFINFKSSLLVLLFLLVSLISISQENTYGFQNIILKTTKYRNGDTLFHAQSVDQWIYASEKGIGAYCYIDNDPLKGILYNWYAVYDKRNIAPVGWKIPREKDFRNLIYKYKKYKFRYTDVIKSNFSGYRDYTYGDYSGFNNLEYFWTSSADRKNIFNASVFMIYKDDQTLSAINSERKENGYSILAIRNYNESIEILPPDHIESKDIVCEGELATLFAVGNDIPSNLKWVWYVGDLKIGEGTTVNYTFKKDVEIKVRSESQKGKKSSFITKKIKVSKKPEKPISIEVKGDLFRSSEINSSICEGERISLIANANLNEGDTYVWTCNDQFRTNDKSFNDLVSEDKRYKLFIKNEVCGTSDFTSVEVKMLRKSDNPIILEEKNSKSKSKSTLYIDKSSNYPGAGAEWCWYKIKKKGKEEFIGKGESIKVNSQKNCNYTVKSQGGTCQNPNATDTYFHLRAPSVVGGHHNEYFRWGLNLGLEGYFLSDSISIMDTTYNLRLNTYGLNYSWRFYPILNDFFTLGIKSNRSLHIGKMGYNLDLANSLSDHSQGNYYLATRTLIGEMLIGFPSQGKLKFMLDYEITRYTTFKSYSNFLSYRVPKKEAIGLGFRVGSYANKVQCDILYTYSKFDQNDLYDFNNSLFNSSHVPRHGIKTSLWIHKILKIDVGVVFDYTNQFNNALVNLGLSYSFDKLER